MNRLPEEQAASQLDDVTLGRIRGHGVSPDSRHLVLGLDAEESVPLPVCLVNIVNLDRREVKVVGRDVDLDVLAGLEVEVNSRRKLHGELLDEGGHVLVGDDLALKLLNA